LAVEAVALVEVALSVEGEALREGGRVVRQSGDDVVRRDVRELRDRL